MKNDDLQRIWKDIEPGTAQRSREELELLLEARSRQTLNSYLIIIGISVLISAALLVFLTVTSLNRRNDPVYLVNNISIAILTLASLISGLVAGHKLKAGFYDKPLKSWLQNRIDILSNWLTGRYSKIYLIVIPVLSIMLMLSIHVYFENKTFMEVLGTEESVIGMIIGLLMGLFVAYYTVRKIRKYQLRNLEFLRDLHRRLGKLT